MADIVLSARSRLANLSRRLDHDPAAILEARRDLNCAKVERAITEALAADIPLSDEQRSRLAALLTGSSK